MSFFNFKTFFEYIKSNDQKIINEGLIKTYPVDTLRKALGTKINELGIKKIQVYSTFTGIPIGLALTVPVLEHFDKIKEILNVYGYYIGLQRGENIQVEPKYPFRVTRDQLPKKAYHVSRRARDKKIMLKGLSPRDSETLFNHPGGRIYLLVTKEIDDIINLKEMLAASKNIEQDELVVFEVDLNEPFYYFDSNLQEGTISDNSFGIFTMQNISPGFLTKTDI
jgi:hypothetical protein